MKNLIDLISNTDCKNLAAIIPLSTQTLFDFLPTANAQTVFA